MPKPQTQKLLLCIVTLTLIGCAQLDYYWQATTGHLGILSHSRPIDDWLADNQVDAATKDQLEFAKMVREFASDTLLLPNNQSYRWYADIGRPYAVVNVFAAPPLSLDLKTWCYPIIGCAVYRGFYDKKEAQKYAKQLESEGLDTLVAPVQAYSTLGYLPDPILNTFINLSREKLAKLIFHELSHQMFFAPGDSELSESFATAVEIIGWDKWQSHTQMINHDIEKPLENMKHIQTNTDATVNPMTEYILNTREQLIQLYASSLSDSEKLLEKSNIINKFRSTLELKFPNNTARTFWNNPNNAHFGSFSTYHGLVPQFLKLYHACEQDLGRFYRVNKEIFSHSTTPEVSRHTLETAITDCQKYKATTEKNSIE